MANDEIEKEQDRPDEGDDVRIELRKEILGGFAIYALLAVCAVFSLVPALLSGGFPKPEGKVLVVTFFSLDDPSTQKQLEHLKMVVLRKCSELKISEGSEAYQVVTELLDRGVEVHFEAGEHPAIEAYEV